MVGSVTKVIGSSGGGVSFVTSIAVTRTEGMSKSTNRSPRRLKTKIGLKTKRRRALPDHRGNTPVVWIHARIAPDADQAQLIEQNI